MRSRLPSLILALLCALPLLGFLPRLLGARTQEPLDRRPTWAQLVVVTTAELPAELDRSGPGLRTLDERAAVAALRVGESQSGAATALWTGRGSAPGAWTLAEAARRTGAATAAFLAAPLATEGAITGFETLVESAELSPERLAVLADEHLASHADVRSLLWLHLADAGPRGAALDDLLARLHAALEARGHRWDALVVVTQLPSEPAGEAVPLWIELPNALYAGRRGTGAADLVELTGTLLSILRLPAPDVTRGELPIAPSSKLSTLLQGGRAE